MALQQRDPVKAQQTFWKLLPRRLLESQAEACGKNDCSHSISRERVNWLIGSFNPAFEMACALCAKASRRAKNGDYIGIENGLQTSRAGFGN